MTANSLIPQEDVCQVSLSCEVGKDVKIRGEKMAELLRLLRLREETFWSENWPFLAKHNFFSRTNFDKR